LSDSTQKPGMHTRAEIFSEPETWKNCLDSLELTGELQTLRKSLPSEGEWIFVGCGSSYYLALIAAATWQLLTDEPARAIPASDILLFPKMLPRVCRPVLISRSGHTSEIIEAGNYLRSRKQPAVLAITCGIGTPIDREAERIIHLPQADEKSTVMTRSFTSMLLVLQLLAAERAGRSEFARGISGLSGQMQPRMQEIDATIRRLADERIFADYVFLGQGPFYGVAQEAMLKVKEMSSSYAQCFHTLEFRHGPKAIVSADTLVTFFLSESGFESELSVLREMKELGAATLVITNTATAAVRESADHLIELSLSVPEAARAAAAVIPGQLLGYYTGLRKGFDPDHPRNLTRVVMLASSSVGDSGRDSA
jgi:glucosamine--fructose-6-phosphate aminotransferase (isomerizing)